MLLQGAIDRYLADLAVGRSSATVATYRSALRLFADTVGPTTPIAALTPEHLLTFARTHSDHGRTPRATVQLYATAATRLYAWLVREDIRPDLPLEKTQLRLQ